MPGAPLVTAVCVLGAVLAVAGPAGAAGRRLRRLTRAPRVVPAPPREPAADAALVLDLVAAALSAGATPAAALDVVGQAVGGPDGGRLRVVADRLRLGAGEAAAWAGTPERLSALRHCLVLTAAAGAPGATLLRDHATQLRRERHRRAQAAAARLGVRVVLPLGLCALPGFAAWGVVPVVLGLASSVLSP